MDTIKFIIEDITKEESDYRYRAVNIYINGENLIDLVGRIERITLASTNLSDSTEPSYVGLNVEWRLNLREEFLGNTQQPFCVLLTCTCYEDECNSIIARIHMDSKTVTWSEFTSRLYGEESRLWGGTPIDYSGLGPFVFDRKQYMDALNALEQSR
ncbi:MAG TPA: hypothetical protein VJM08_04580 [Anaerolineales bacterium]|nr:hypothetical protein [Anaerolineales bacterium]